MIIKIIKCFCSFIKRNCKIVFDYMATLTLQVANDKINILYIYLNLLIYKKNYAKKDF